jgi:2-polyprenyl-6-methoxyphenol hydroxylase-like FAD-dependent oxidoreductase
MTTVLISGASVGGPALAYWLHRYGFTTTVVERAPAPRPGGYAVDFRGASLKVLDRMGILAEVEARATRMGSMVYVNESGKAVATTTPEAFSGELEILRGDLVDVLYELTAATTEYMFDDSIASLDQDESGVDVVFESGLRRRFDLVIGADGLHSNVRRLAFGPESSYVHDLGYYASVFTVENHLGLDHTGRIFTEPGKTVGTYSARDNAEAKALFYFASEPLSYDRRDLPAQQAIVTEQFAGIGWEVPRLLDGMRTAPDFTSTRSVRSSSTATPVAGSRWSATRGTAPRRCPGWARAWRSSVRTSWPVSCTRPVATTTLRSASTTYGCGDSSRPVRSKAWTGRAGSSRGASCPWCCGT